MEEKLKLEEQQPLQVVEKVQDQHIQTIDPLTNTYNKTYFDKHISEIIIRNQHNDYETGIICFNVDLMSRLNENYSFEIGDSVLQSLSLLVTEFKTPQTDYLFRLTDSEFALVIPTKSQEELFYYCEILRDVIYNHHFETVEKITCSLGAVIFNQNLSIDTNLKQAEFMLETSKKQGRNQTNLLNPNSSLFLEEQNKKQTF